MRRGRFTRPASELTQRFGESVSFDRRLYRHDIAGSCAHAAALAAAGIITEEELSKIKMGLSEIAQEIDAGQFQWDYSLEDVHMNIEAALTERIGEAGTKLHTGRSRNDQVALDLRLYVKAEAEATVRQVRSAQSALLDLAVRHREVIMPGYTHMQRAQPIFFAHYLLAQIEAFDRDVARLRDCQRRTDVLPLGSGAIAGSTIVLNRQLLADELGFSRLSQNSLDVVGDRDFVCEFLFCLALIGTHLSRLAEDLIIWSTSEFGFIEFSDAFSTGSSLMPQKKNPDMAELARAKTGRLYGNLISMLTVLKGLPLSYNRDLQEDKEALFDSTDTVRATLEVFAALLPELKIECGRLEAAASDPLLLATDLAEYLVGKGLAFRSAHEVVGNLVAHAMENNLPLNRIALEEMRKFSKLFGADVAAVFEPRASLAKRVAAGAPAPENVAERIEYWRTVLAAG